MDPRPAQTVKWADIKARIAARAAQAQREGKTIRVTVSAPTLKEKA